ncbi:alpha/beta hydrolase [Campylobacter sp. 19-13652]|uniref:alpha/beta hydrolase n=1 Tax=Campylobacter sp. 19-13652 TaxID=2840180 RepID=UPI001C76FEFA|nr:alpha/beta hydrolase [Campylobacter sp. 19-13652]BCX78971.1 hypothetical protein LBC_04330 [Campylobacter sp. 19-13652]
MKKLLLLALFSLLLNASEFKSFKYLPQEFKPIAKDWASDISSLEQVKEWQNYMLEQAKSARKPDFARKAKLAGAPDVSLYFYLPSAKSDKPLPAIFFIHGGGYLVGSALSGGDAFYALANSVNAVIISLEYRLSTTAPFPAQLDDAYAGLSYVFTHAALLGIDSSRIAIMGESAGGNLAAALALYARDMGEFSPLAQILIYPMLDYTTAAPKSPLAGEFIWTAGSNRFAWEVLKGGKNLSQKELGYFSPSYASDLHGLPRALIMVGGLDLFADEDIEYARRLLASGVQTQLFVLPNFLHAYEHIMPNSPLSAEFIRTRDKAIDKILN